MFPRIMLNPLLNDSGAALLLGISKSEIRQLVERDEIPHIRLPTGSIRFVDAELCRWAESFRSGKHTSPLLSLVEAPTR